MDPWLKHAFSFKGRTSRKEYWTTMILYDLLCIVLGAFTGSVLSGTVSDSALITIAVVIWLIIAVIGFWLMLSQGAKRCHDLGHSGWWQLIPVCILWILFAAGNAGENDYGPDPKGDDD